MCRVNVFAEFKLIRLGDKVRSTSRYNKRHIKFSDAFFFQQKKN